MSADGKQRLSLHEQALVAVAVLVDGAEAANVLALDARRGEVLKAEAASWSEIELDARLPFVGTQLRRALEREGA
jgi:hypothetical protein